MCPSKPALHGDFVSAIAKMLREVVLLMMHPVYTDAVHMSAATWLCWTGNKGTPCYTHLPLL